MRLTASATALLLWLRVCASFSFCAESSLCSVVKYLGHCRNVHAVYRSGVKAGEVCAATLLRNQVSFDCLSKVTHVDATDTSLEYQCLAAAQHWQPKLIDTTLALTSHVPDRLT
jgi:hypothetical protein